jgi:glutamate-1-semialdehyde 2,1-aminomutase
MPSGVPMAWMAGFYEHPTVFVDHGEGAWFTDVDGNRYLDVNLVDSSSFCGFGPPAVVEAVSRRLRSGSQFLLANEDALYVAEALSERFGLPQWQLTLSATQANMEAIRLARAATGRQKVVVFEGKYHGMLDETLAVNEGGRTVAEYAGVAARAVADTVVVAFNDLVGVEEVLGGRDVACVLTEPALTNHGIVLPTSGFHDSLRSQCSRTGTVLIVDEAHTLQCGPGGLTRAWGLRADIVTLGKSLGGSIPVGAYGMVDSIADLLAPRHPRGAEWSSSFEEVATGGTFSGGALQSAACRAVLERILTGECYARTSALGTRLADGLEAHVRTAGLPWVVERLPGKASYRPSRSVTGERDDPEWRALSAAVRVWFANRGVWEATRWGGPAVSAPMSEDDVDLYVGLFGNLVEDLTR